MLNVFELAGGQEDVYEKLIGESMFRTRCMIPGIFQKYNPSNNTAEIQPAIRERVIEENGAVKYQQIPLLINVPVVFPSTSNASITFPINKGDECLVIFSDLSIDNFWEKGNVQNPVEVRRHDLSDGIAIPCRLSLPKTKTVNQGALVVSYGSSSISLGSSVVVKTGDRTVDLSNFFDKYYNHKHTVTIGIEKYTTSKPE